MKEVIIYISPVITLLAIIKITLMLKKEQMKLKKKRTKRVVAGMETKAITPAEIMWLVKLGLLLVIGSIVFTETMLTMMHNIF